MAYSIEEARFHVRSLGQNLKKDGLMIRTWGNVSVRVSEDSFVISPSGRDFAGLTSDEIVKVNIKDGSYESGKVPSSEYLLHLITYKVHPEAQCVIHTHQPVASAISVLGIDFEDIKQYIPEGMTRDVNILGSKIPTIQYEMAGSKEAMKAVGKAWKKNPYSAALLMRNHGALVWGEEVRETYYTVKMLEKMSRWIYCSVIDIEEDELDFDMMFDAKYREKLRWAPSLKEMQSRYSFISRSPFLKRFSNLGLDLEAYLDDMAQIAGPRVKNIVKQIGQVQLARELMNSDSVMLKGKGAICTGPDEEEARFLCQVLEKAAMAAYLAKKQGAAMPIPEKISERIRKHYVEIYSKRRK